MAYEVTTLAIVRGDGGQTCRECFFAVLPVSARCTSASFAPDWVGAAEYGPTLIKETT